MKIDKKLHEIMRRSMSVQDYIYCEDCEMYADLWKYGTVIDAGHESCSWRFVKMHELDECIRECMKDGCFTENRAQSRLKGSGTLFRCPFCNSGLELDAGLQGIRDGRIVESRFHRCGKCGKRFVETWKCEGWKEEAG